ncbi:hypothetical protein DY000_02006549 [Brassica cretica]|uniref:Uncharacterized protein n=1 Tax=Brassica cretica TaxID=69181 RepID=A0ABQ7C7L7_BRACR|nr:hypothetical protein DY000_02006549 [Brassica cretica]
MHFECSARSGTVVRLLYVKNSIFALFFSSFHPTGLSPIQCNSRPVWVWALVHLDVQHLSFASALVGILTALQDAVDSVGVTDRCSGEPVDRFGLKSVDRVQSPASIDTSAIRRSSSNFLLRNFFLAASLASPLAINHLI